MANHDDGAVQARLKNLEDTRIEFRALLVSMGNDINSIKTSVALIVQDLTNRPAPGQSPVCIAQNEKLDSLMKKSSTLETTVNRWAGGLALACVFMPVLTGLIIAHFTKK